MDLHLQMPAIPSPTLVTPVPSIRLDLSFHSFLSNTSGSLSDRHLESGVQEKKVGLSRTVINGKVWEFRAHDTSHPQSERIYVKLDEMLATSKGHSYQLDLSQITRPLQNDKTAESAVCDHSERLAITFNLIQMPPSNVIYLTNSLRTCSDCHTVPIEKYDPWLVYVVL